MGMMDGERVSTTDDADDAMLTGSFVGLVVEIM